MALSMVSVLRHATFTERLHRPPAELGFTDTGSLLSSLSLMDRINGSVLFQSVVLDSINTALSRQLNDPQ